MQKMNFDGFCFQRAVKKKCSGEHANHWMDMATDKYDAKLVEIVKALIRVFLIFVQLPVFWAHIKQEKKWNAPRKAKFLPNAGTIPHLSKK